MSKATFQALGTGDGWASDRRGHSAFLFKLEDSTLLLDWEDNRSCLIPIREKIGKRGAMKRGTM